MDAQVVCLGAGLGVEDWDLYVGGRDHFIVELYLKDFKTIINSY